MKKNNKNNTENIPKKIHYCWFGGKELPKLAKKCIESWKKYCPDYEIIEWNEKNFDININTYVKEAYENKKWAFVTDYVRLYVLYNHGGIYMDTDVEVIKNIDEFLDNDAFFGFENIDYVSTGIMASKKRNQLFKTFMDYYNDRSFVTQDGKLDMTTNVKIITDILSTKGLKKNNKKQTIEGLTIYPCEFFCPLDFNSKKLRKTKNTYVIHWYMGSWLDLKTKLKLKTWKIGSFIIGEKNMCKISNKIKGKEKL